MLGDSFGPSCDSPVVCRRFNRSSPLGWDIFLVEQMHTHMV